MSKRRPNGDGMVRKRPDGRWEARIIVGHKEDGKPIYKSVFGKTQSEAMTKFYKLLETYRGVELNEDCLVNLNEWLDRWLCYQKDVVRPQTLNKYVFYADAYVRPYLGYKKISAILTRDMQQLYIKLLKEGRVTESKAKGKSLSGSTVKAVHIHEEIARLLIQAKEEGFYELILLGLATGMRRGELLGLKWDDINFTTGELSIRREYTTLGSDYIISTPKTKSSVRSVHLPQSVLNILGEYRKTVSSEWVFPSPLDPSHPRGPTSCRSRLSDMLERAECNHIPFHGLRHIFSTMALENGLDIKTLSAVLGHSSAETTISVYSHVTGEMERNAAKKMDDAFGTPKPADLPVCDDNHEDGQTPEQKQKIAEFTAKKSKKRKPGTGCISKVSKNTWQGKYTPRGKDGKREQHVVYAKSEEECEWRLKEMIGQIKIQGTDISELC